MSRNSDHEKDKKTWNLYLLSQIIPEYPGGQVHWNVLPESAHTPPFTHGFGAQGDAMVVCWVVVVMCAQNGVECKKMVMMLMCGKRSRL